MKTFYLDYKIAKDGTRTIHRVACHLMPKIDYCLLLGEFHSTDSLYNYAIGQFPQWLISKCSCCH
ncbi:hypothetical protein [Carboxylicivirga marina]|uniref:hypothetical protein n=1 Tax=Carboxylicivirga marina TaxID=2800988 RepID=UPI003D352A5D